MTQQQQLHDVSTHHSQLRNALDWLLSSCTTAKCLCRGRDAESDLAHPSQGNPALGNHQASEQLQEQLPAAGQAQQKNGGPALAQWLGPTCAQTLQHENGDGLSGMHKAEQL